ncbi:MAG: hypothetical protein ABJZ55_01990 [Fuerstiella sp.]
MISHWLTEVGNNTVVFPFLTLDGSLVPAADRPERVIYKGVTGIGAWFDGARGEPFGVSTFTDIHDGATAITTFSQYQAKIGLLMDLYYLGAKWGSVLIHDVSLKEFRTVASVVGGITVTNGNPGVLVYADWKLETLPS